jgi:hypothetical protein
MQQPKDMHNLTKANTCNMPHHNIILLFLPGITTPPTYVVVALEGGGARDGVNLKMLPLEFEIGAEARRS